MMVLAYIQARMSSARFPGKVLAPFRGRPILDWVLDGVAATGIGAVVLTSTQASDDPLAHHAKARGVAVFRGPLDDVLGRFLGALTAHPTEKIVRICCDSPLVAPGVIQAVVRAGTDDLDLVTTTHPRTFPKGQNVELVRSDTLRAVDGAQPSSEDREHVTRFIHERPHQFRIRSVTRSPSLAEVNLAVDTLDDLRRLEALSEVDIDSFRQGSP